MKEQDSSLLPNFNSNAWRDQTIDDHSESHLRGRTQNKQNFGGNIMSSEELKIRSELEMDIERDLEEEIKDGIYHLALRLHRLYQHQKERNETEYTTQNQQEIKKKTLSEVNINIKLEGGTSKIEIKEIKKECHHQPPTSRSENNYMQGKPVLADAKKFDWAKTLRSGASPVGFNKKNDSSHRARMQSSAGTSSHNLKFDNGRRNCTSASGQRKGNVHAENKVLQLGWRF